MLASLLSRHRVGDIAHPRLTVRALPQAAESGQAGVGRGAWLRLSGRAVSERGLLPPTAPSASKR